MIQSPCLNCELRHLNCHNSCKKYLKFKLLKHRENKIISSNKSLESMLTSIDIKKRKRRK